MLDNISGTATTSQNNSQSQQQSSTSSQITLDFDSILQELKSVGEAHQPEQQTMMIVENITANMKQESQIHTNSGKRKKSEGRKSSNQSPLFFLLFFE